MSRNIGQNMSQDKLYEKFGVNPEYLEASAAEYENPSWEKMQFGKITQGRPRVSDEPLRTVTVKVPESRIFAIKSAAEKRGVSRSAFLRQAIDNELISMS